MLSSNSPCKPCYEALSQLTRNVPLCADEATHDRFPASSAARGLYALVEYQARQDRRPHPRRLAIGRAEAQKSRLWNLRGCNAWVRLWPLRRLHAARPRLVSDRSRRTGLLLAEVSRHMPCIITDGLVHPPELDLWGLRFCLLACARRPDQNTGAGRARRGADSRDRWRAPRLRVYTAAALDMPDAVTAPCRRKNQSLRLARLACWWQCGVSRPTESSPGNGSLRNGGRAGSAA